MKRIIHLFAKGICLLSFFGHTSLRASAQAEFPKGWVLYAGGSQGCNTNFGLTPDRYIGGLDLKPMVTVIPDHLRLGALAGLIYTDQRVDAMAGPLVAWKVTKFAIPAFAGTLGNLQLQLGYFRGSGDHSAVGGGPFVEVARKFQVGITAFRDYGINSWLFQLGLGINLLSKKIQSDPFQH